MQHLNHAEIDRDHQHFADITTRLKTSNTDQFKTLFSELLSHTESHFKREEQLIEQYRYPGKSEHCGEHNRLLTELRQFNQRVQQGRLSLARAYINERVDAWLQQHISNMDAALVKHIESHS
ncbi:hemerythrin family protein [uncultured Amphritea sp.]|uniref:bacteriohemerythrin n=1 Tax=uncultured Amphritea sp. TaxID=981605 RepID=UPI0026296F35|nr:hemerythrin family protein [uncultured Amphritea sp.]